MKVAAFRSFDPSTGAERFNTYTDHTLFNVDQRQIDGAAVGLGNGIHIDYPEHAGRRVYVTLVSPFQVGDIDGWAVLSCRLEYVSGVPRVRIFVDNNTQAIPICDGQLTVCWTGESI